jgi:ActR/RegA family two-component response regulator
MRLSHQRRDSPFSNRGPLVVLADPAVDSLAQLAVDLGREGYRSVCVPDLGRALRRARAGGPALIVTELWFPGAYGLAVVERWRAALPDTPLVVATSVADIATAMASLRGGAVDVLTKPVSARDVLAAVEDRFLPPLTRLGPPSMSIVQATETYLRMVVTSASTLTEAARQLGVDRRSLRRILNRHRWAAPRCRT